MNSKYMRKFVLTSVFLCICAVFFIFFKTAAPKDRTVSVTGTARVYIEPDEASISFTLYTKDAELLTAKQKNDVLLQKLKKILNDFAIEQKHLTVDYTAVNPEYQYHHQTDERIRTGYAVRQNISVKITNITQYEAFITALLNAGIDMINNTEFGNSQLKKYQNEARSKAIHAATQKAQFFCEEASKAHKPIKLGKVLNMQEMRMDGYTMPRNLRTQNAKYANLEAADVDESEAGLIPFGVIAVQADVEMTFSLK